MELNDLWAFADWLTAQLGDGYTVISGPIPVTAPDRAIGVQDYDPGRPGENWQGNYAVQILCRGAQDSEGLSSYNDAHALTDTVLPIVKPAGHKPVVVITGGRRALLSWISGPHSLGPDEQGRWRFSINVALDTTRG